MLILASDPGTYETGYMIFDPETWEIKECGKIKNEILLDKIERLSPYFDLLVSEDITSFTRNSKYLIETIRWTGKFEHAANWNDKKCQYITRQFVKKHLMGKIN